MTTRLLDKTWFRIGATLATGAMGGAGLDGLGFPAAWISGAMLGMAALGFMGIRPCLPEPLRDLGLMLVGVATGCAITPQMLGAVAQYPASLVLLAITTGLVVIVGRFVMMRLFAWDAHSALFGAMPGALSAVIAAVDDMGGDMLKVVVVQTFRVFVLIGLLPGLIEMSVPHQPIVGELLLSAPGFAVSMVLAVVLALAFMRIRLIAPFMFGGMVAAGALHLSGFVAGTVPASLTNLAMLLVGILAGQRFADIDYASLRRLILPSLVLFIVSLAIAVFGGFVASKWLDIPLVQVLVAYAPGGLEAMVLLGIVLGIDPLYVTSHHVARFVLLALALPLMTNRTPPKAS